MSEQVVTLNDVNNNLRKIEHKLVIDVGVKIDRMLDANRILLNMLSKKEEI